MEKEMLYDTQLYAFVGILWVVLGLWFMVGFSIHRLKRIQKTRAQNSERNILPHKDYAASYISQQLSQQPTDLTPSRVQAVEDIWK